MKSSRTHTATAWAVFAASLALYLLTVAPTISFWDSAEFVVCSYILGIPHPPGAPLLTLIGRVMMLLPFYDFRGGGLAYPAFRANLIAVLTAAFTAMLTYLVIVRLITRMRPFRGEMKYDWPVMFSAAAAALMAALGNQFWENAVEIETYMPALCLSVTALWLTLRWEARRDDPRAVGYLLLAAYLVGLGVGIHLSALLIAPAAVIIVFAARPDWFAGNRTRIALALFLAAIILVRLLAGKQAFYTTAGMFALVAPLVLARLHRPGRTSWQTPIYGVMLAVSLYVIGYSVYPTIMIRASDNPAIDQGDPDTWSRFGDYLERTQYNQGNMYTGMVSRNAAPSYQFNFMYLRYFLQQFPDWGPSPDITFYNGYSPEQTEPVLVTDTAPAPVILLLLLVLGMIVHLRRDKSHFFAVFLFFLLTSAGLVLYLNMDNPQARERDYFFLGSFQIMMVWLGIGMFAMLDRLREFLDHRGGAKTAGIVTALTAAILATMVPAAVLSRHIDPAYTSFQLHDRSRNVIPLEYGVNMLESCEPDAILFSYGDNDTFPLWYAQYVRGIRPDVRVINMSILNAPWYIKQLRDQPPAVPIGLSDDFIDNQLTADASLTRQSPLEWTASPRTVTIAGMTWNMPPDYLYGNRGMLSVASYMTAHIIDANDWKRPIYFAVGTPQFTRIGLDNHMRMDGLVFRLVRGENTAGPYQIDTAVLERNLTVTYRYSGIADPTVYKAPETASLLRNYAVGFADLAEACLQEGDTAGVKRAVDAGLEDIAPGLDMRVYYAGALKAAGFDSEFDTLMAEDIAGAGGNGGSIVPEYWKGYIRVLVRGERYEDALSAVDSLLAIAPGDQEGRIMRSELERMISQSAPE